MQVEASVHISVKEIAACYLMFLTLRSLSQGQSHSNRYNQKVTLSSHSLLLSITCDKHTWLAVLTIFGEYLSLDLAIATIFFSPPTLRTCLKRSKNRIISIQQTLHAALSLRGGTAIT